MIADGQVNGSHARHYVAQAAGHHGAIVRLQEENASLRARLAAREPEPTETGLFDIALVVTVRGYSRDDAEHLGRLYRDRVQALAPAWPVEVQGVRVSKRGAI